jgi:hypothetical protein
MIELLAIDHWTHHRIKPAKSYIPEWEKKEKFALLNRMYLPHNKYRYVVTETSFDCEILLQQNITIMERKILVLEYNGVEKPKFR